MIVLVVPLTTGRIAIFCSPPTPNIPPIFLPSGDSSARYTNGRLANASTLGGAVGAGAVGSVAVGGVWAIAVPVNSNAASRKRQIMHFPPK